MYSKSLIAAAVALTLTTGGCVTNPATGQSQIDPNFLQTVQQVTATACAVLPTVETVVAIFNQNAAQTAQQVSTAICSAVSTKAARAAPLSSTRGAPAVLGVTPSGIKIQGWRTQ